MNPGQEKFYQFFMERVILGKENEADALLKKGFAKQQEGTFDSAYLEKMSGKYFELIKPECQNELKAAMQHFSSFLK